MAAALPSAPAPQPPVVNHVRQLFRPALEQPHATAPAQIIEQPENNVRASRRAYRRELEKLRRENWDKEQAGWAAVFDAGIAGDDPLVYDDSFWRRRKAVAEDA